MRTLLFLALAAAAGPAGARNAIVCLYQGRGGEPSGLDTSAPQAYFDFAEVSFTHALRGSGKARLSYRKMLPRNVAAEEAPRRRFRKEGSFGYDVRQKKWDGVWTDELGSARLELKKLENPYSSDELPDDAPGGISGTLTLAYKKGGAAETWLFSCSAGAGGLAERPTRPGLCQLYVPQALDPTYNDASFRRRCQMPHRFEIMKWIHSPDGRPYYLSGIYPGQWDAREGYRLFGQAGGRNPDQHVSTSSICQDAQKKWRFLIQYHVNRLVCN